MKKQLISLSLLATCISINAFAAGPVANIQVSGDIKPPTCTVNGGDNDIIFDYGNISPSLIQTDSNYALGLREADIQISCDSETYLTFTASDVYTSTTASNWRAGIFGLVNEDNTEQEIGGLLIKALNINVDGAQAYWGRTGSVTWSSNYIVKDTTIGWTTESQTQVDESQLKLASGKIFSATLQTGSTNNNPDYGYVLSKNKLESQGLDISNGVNYLGQAILTFSFGV